MKKVLISARIIYMIYITVLLVICLSSCSSTKKLEKSSFTSDVKMETGVQKQSAEKQTDNTGLQTETSTNKITQSSENDNEETVISSITYDTSKSIVTATGKPPVASETTTTKKKLSQKDSKIQENLTEKLNLQMETNRQLIQKTDSQAKVISSLKSKSEVKTTTMSNWWRWLLFGILVGASLVFLIIHFKWYELIWTRIKKIFSLIRKMSGI